MMATTRRHQAWLGLAAAVLLASPPLRGLLESRMATHMLLQFPLLMLAGACLAQAVSPALQCRLAAWNAHGIAGLTWAAGALALGMVPRLLDLALTDGPTEAAKFMALLVTGAALRLSWHAAGTLVQGFFLGNTLPMMGIVGWMYGDAPVRICNAYGFDDQQTVGLALSWTAAATAAIWLVLVVRALTSAAPLQPP
jgi:hypothetical protein